MSEEITDELAEIQEEENFDNAFEDEVDNTVYEPNERNEDLQTHDKIRSHLCGSIIKLEAGYSKTTLQTTKEMSLDDFGLIHSGFIFGAADYAAAVAVNEPNVVIIGSRSKFLAPAKVDDMIEFVAYAKFEDSRKREIKVTGHINEIKVFEAVFQAVVLEQHIFKTKIKNAGRKY